MRDRVRAITEHNAQCAFDPEKLKGVRSAGLQYSCRSIDAEVEALHESGLMTLNFDVKCDEARPVREETMVEFVDMTFSRAEWAAFKAYVDQAWQTPDDEEVIP